MRAETPLVSPARKLISIDEILHARRERPIASTRGRDWGGVTIDMHRPYFNCAESYAGLDHHLVCFCPSGSARLIQRRAGKEHNSVISAGMSYIMPAGYESSWEGDSGWSARLRVPQALLGLAAEQLGRSNGRVEVLNVFQVRDTTTESIARVLLAEMDKPAHPAQALIMDAMSAALAAHMLRSYNGYPVAPAGPEHALGKREAARLVEYIEDNLDHAITLAELAAVVQVSRFHFARLFKRSFGVTAIAFVERCRIQRAQALIAETDLPLADIALIVGFADQSHFTRRFQLHAGCTPAVYARELGRRRPGPRWVKP